MACPLRSSVPHFPLRCDKSVTVNLGPSSRIQGQSQGGLAMKKRVVIAFFATSLTAGASFAADGTATLSIGASHGRRMDGHLFWSQCRLRLGAGLINYRFWRRID